MVSVSGAGVTAWKYQYGVMPMKKVKEKSYEKVVRGDPCRHCGTRISKIIKITKRSITYKCVICSEEIKEDA